MEIGLPEEEKLASYLRMDIRDETERKIACILQDILDGKTISNENASALLKYVRECNIRIFNMQL